MIGWFFTPGRRWFQVADAAAGILLDLRRARERGRGKQQ